jgi:hypothetical protein
MAVVKLAIVEPQNGQRFSGSAQAASVRLRGSTSSTRPLFYRWYSGIDGELNEASASALDIQRPLTVGSHVITFTAKDVQGDGLEDIEAVQEAGMTGGPPNPAVESPCVVHIFIATVIEPPDHAALSRAGGSSLTAVAPKQWGKKVGSSSVYETNPDYHGDASTGQIPINKIRYRWRFQPSGPPEGRAAKDLVLGVNDLTFLTNPAGGDLMTVRYQGRLPDGLDTGNYTLALRVEELVEGQSAPTFGDETSPRAVIIT